MTDHLEAQLVYLPRAFDLRWDAFDCLASGLGDAETVTLLRGGQFSQRVLLLRVLAERLDALAASDADARRARTALGLLGSLARQDPRAVERVLLHPPNGVWLVRCLRLLAGSRAATVDPGGASTPAETAETRRVLLGRAAALTMVAALRRDRGGPRTVDIPVRARLPVSDGVVHLPSMGRLLLHGADRRLRELPVLVDGEGRLRRTDNGVVCLRPGADGEPGGAGWRPARRIRTGAGRLSLDVLVEDADPCRDDHRWAVVPPLHDGEYRCWSSQLSLAWELLARRHRLHAYGMSRGLTAIVPLAARRGGLVSATSPRTFGAVGVCRPDDPIRLAALLVHEFQHAKLGALHDVVPLYAPGGKERYRAPWRTDPRSAGALLHGAYAHLALAEFWSREREAAPVAARHDADLAFAVCREQVADALATLATCDELTEAGRRFVLGMRVGARTLESGHVPRAVAAEARSIAEAEAARWHGSYGIPPVRRTSPGRSRAIG